jgi:molecular chaperone GrpE
MMMNDTKRDNAKRDNDSGLDAEALAELRGVPEELRDSGEPEAADSARTAERIAALEEELAAVRQDVLYAQADTQNLRRRMEKEVQDARAYAATGFARDILSVADNMQRALAAIPAELREDEQWRGLVTGIEATGRELAKALEKNGIKRIAAMGLPLDPNAHQAMIEIPTGDAEPGTVVQEMQAGYMINDRLLRPAMVGVAKASDLA